MANNPYSREGMLEAFNTLGAEIKEIEEASPRLQRDAEYATLNEAQKAAYKEQIKEHEEGLFDKRQTYASLARALKSIK